MKALPVKDYSQIVGTKTQLLWDKNLTVVGQKPNLTWDKNPTFNSKWDKNPTFNSKYMGVKHEVATK